MKNIISIILLLISLSICSLVYATAEEETGDTRARPISCYGTEDDGTITAILVDSDGVIQTV